MKRKWFVVLALTLCCMVFGAPITTEACTEYYDIIWNARAVDFGGQVGCTGPAYYTCTIVCLCDGGEYYCCADDDGGHWFCE